jgi:hypothetical protein
MGLASLLGKNVQRINREARKEDRAQGKVAYKQQYNAQERYNKQAIAREEHQQKMSMDITKQHEAHEARKPANLWQSKWGQSFSK